MKQYNRYNTILGWIVFAIATVVYALTVELTASWWDCGEYISTAYKLQVGHPPGAPLFQLVGRFFSLFAFGDTSRVALMINMMSVLSSSFTILFLFWTITMLAEKMVFRKGEEITTGQIYTVLGAGVVGALAYTFSDSFWFSAVEGEVYAMSSFFTALVFWAILKWEKVADEPHAFRWLIFIAYMMGLSIGVHLLNLLAIPAIAFVYYYKKHKATPKGVIITAVISILLLAFIMYVIVPEIVNQFAKAELLFVNTLGLPFNSGTIAIALIIIGLCITAILYTIKDPVSPALRWSVLILLGLLVILILAASSSGGNFVIRLIFCGALLTLLYLVRYRKDLLNTVILCFVFILIGYSSFLLIVIRANANTPINENEPSDAISLLSYLNREQYGDWPIFYGQYYNTPLDPENPYKDGNPVYIKDYKTGKYVITDDRKSSIPNYDSRFCTLFPRMWSNQKDSHESAYKQWGRIKGHPIRYTNRQGETQVIIKPTFGENLRFFFNYQVGHMYWRYFLWNFVGRQNDIEGHGGIAEGNWISGIPFIDRMHIGSQENLPFSMQNPARNKFYALPLILGLAGLFYHWKRDRNNTFVVALLYIMTGFAIIVYLNQYPYQPRERDYAYAGSFYAFAIWIGMGVMAVTELFNRFLKPHLAAILATALCIILVPFIMAQQGWDDHDRSGKYAARDFASNYLNSCAPNAILITNGDNDTFPLWYAQEVEGIRTDVRVVNFMLASGDWYVHQMMKKVYDSDPLPFTLKAEQYNKGVNEIIPYYEESSIKGRYELKKVIDFIANESQSTRLPVQSGEWINYFPTKSVRLSVDSANAVKKGIVPAYYADRIEPYVDWQIKTNYLYRNDLMLLDFLATNNWERPLYFANPNSLSQVLDVDAYCHLEGFVYRFMPVKADSYIKSLGGLNTEASYDILMNKCKWGNLNDPRVTIDRESYRNTMIPKQNFMRLVQALMDEKKVDSAVRVTDRVLEIFPNAKIPFDLYMIPFLEIYYQAGEIGKANQLSEILLKNYEENITYYQSLSGRFAEYYSEDLEQAFMVLNRLAEMAREYEQKELADRIDGIIKYRLDLFK
ncbi:MAG: DUF2723 domain-containing protein [Bacteroidales bacterium]|nr:DUF2723 domain-containing protein [Lentimicrobiaceae bacterium]MDD5694284.1 DUF2723 domain-containing protein [Bacteroidales bacterium]